MYDYSPLGKILSQTSTNGSCQLTRYFPTEMNDLFHGLEFTRVNIYDLLVLTKVDWTDHVQKL